MFGQSFEAHDLLVIGLLVVLEGILSIDNALVLGVLARRLPKRQQRKALTYGLVGAFVFRFAAIGLAAYLMKVTLVKLLGGGYLLFIGVKHFATGGAGGAGDSPSDILHSDLPAEQKAAIVTGEATTAQAEAVVRAATPQMSSAAANTPPSPAVIQKLGFDWRFWYTVGVIELTDIAFAIDSILAAVGLVKGPEKTWVVIAGGFLGVIMMRFAAVLFIKLLEKFPRFEHAAYLLVITIGAKLVIDWASYRFHFHDAVNFHSPTSPAFWIFWVTMLACFAVGFWPQKQKPELAGATH
jgi:YkoY family integral membrane protein